MDGDQGDDELGRVAEGCVEEPADARPRVLRRMLGRLADDPRERHERGRREHELDRLRKVGEVVQRDHDGRERERSEEDPPHHRAAKPIGLDPTAWP